jgi:signal peptidase
VKKENVIGKLVFTIPYIGYIGYFVRTPIGLILLIVLPASLIIIIEIRNVIKELKNKNPSNNVHDGARSIVKNLENLKFRISP